MQHEINLRKLAFLHHILNLDDDDPVKKVYRAEQRLEFEPNWANEIIKKFLCLAVLALTASNNQCPAIFSMRPFHS